MQKPLGSRRLKATEDVTVPRHHLPVTWGSRQACPAFSLASASGSVTAVRPSGALLSRALVSRCLTVMPAVAFPYQPQTETAVEQTAETMPPPDTFEAFLIRYADKKIEMKTILYDGETRFWARPKGIDGRTVDFLVIGNTMIPLPFGAESMQRHEAEAKPVSAVQDRGYSRPFYQLPAPIPDSPAFRVEPIETIARRAMRDAALGYAIEHVHNNPDMNVLACAKDFEMFLAGGTP